MDKLGWFMSRHLAQHPQHVKVSPWGRPTRRGFNYTRWQYEADTEKERPTQPSCIMLNITHRGLHWRLYDSEIQKGGKPLLYDVQHNSDWQTLPPCMVFNMTERGKHCHLM